jgi:1-acyl-sn-glycerol-3-phosphate acyltransferase
MYYLLVKSVFWLPVRFYFRIRVVGRQKIPRPGPLVVVANHTSFLDPILLGSAFPRIIHFFVLQKMYDLMSLCWFYVGMGTIPVGGESGDHQALRIAMKALDRGQVLGIFPEGSRSHDGRLGIGKLGAAYIAAKSGAPILPAHIAGAFEAMPPGTRFPRPCPIRVSFGEPIRFEVPAGRRVARSDLVRFADRLQQSIAALAESDAAMTSKPAGAA